MTDEKLAQLAELTERMEEAARMSMRAAQLHEEAAGKMAQAGAMIADALPVLNRLSHVLEEANLGPIANHMGEVVDRLEAAVRRIPDNF